jgi:hypothetical protein
MSEADQILARFMVDDEFYCSRNLKIRDKNGNILPFVWNASGSVNNTNSSLSLRASISPIDSILA